MPDAPTPILTIRGETVALGPMRRDLLPLFQRWINDPRVSRTLTLGNRPQTLEDENGCYDALTKDSSNAAYVIYALDHLVPIGATELHAIDTANKTAEVGIMIGEASARGRGFGTEAVRLLCDIGFWGLDLHSIMLETYGWNVAGQKAYTKAGFREIGRRRQARRFNGEWHDVILYDLLRDEFESPVMRRLMLDGDYSPDAANVAE